MAVRDIHRNLAERGFQTDAAKRVGWPPDLDAGRLGLVRDDLAMGELHEALDESLCAIGGHIDAVFGHGLKRGIGWFGRVPVQLHVNAARPLDHRVAADRIGEGRDDDVGPGRARRADRDVQIGNEVAGPLGPEWIGNGRLEAEQRDRADRRLEQLRGGAAGGWRHVGDDLLGALAAEGRKEACDKPVHILGRDIDVGGVVLRSDSDSGKRRL